MRYAALLILCVVPPVLKPGAPEIASDHLTDATASERLMKADSEIGQYTHQWRVSPDGNLLLVSSGRVRDKQFVDSAVVKRRGLAPISEIAYLGSRVLKWTYHGPTVTFDSGARHVEHTYPVPVFDFQELDDLLRSLPLTPGYETILPLYSEGTDTLEMDTARVVSRDSAGRWTLRFADPAIVATYTIDERTRWIVGHEQILRRNGVRYRYEEIPLAATGN